MNDDASSQSSMNSYKCSNFQNYDPGNNNNEDEHGPITAVDEAAGAEQKKLKCTRSSNSSPGGEEGGEASNFTKQFRYPTKMDSSCGSCRCGGWGRRLTRNRSSVEERRSLQLQRSLLMEEMYKYKRRMFNTVGAIEGIGFQHPDRGHGCYHHRSRPSFL